MRALQMAQIVLGLSGALLRGLACLLDAGEDVSPSRDLGPRLLGRRLRACGAVPR